MAKKRVPAPTVDPLDRYRALLDAESFDELLRALQTPLSQAVRLNPLKVEPAQAIAALAQRYGWQTQPLPFCDAGWQVIAAQKSLSATIEYGLGQYFIQDAASMLPVELFDFAAAPGAPHILDLAAAPGGKSTHLAARSGDRGLLLANDSSQARIPALRSVLRDWGVANCAVSCFPGERIGAWLPAAFDLVLLDAPCSMENLRPSPGHARRFTSPRERESLAGRQLRLLISALQAARVGGQIVYSTCTLAPEENEAVLDALLNRFPGALQIEDAGKQLGSAAGGLAADETHSFHPSVSGAARIWPHRYGTSGFFAARLSKLDETPAPQPPAPARPLEKSGWLRLSAREARDLTAFLTAQYGFDLPTVLAEHALALWRRGAGVFALPEAALAALGNLPLESAGLLLAEDALAGWQISHEWAARFGRAFQTGWFTLDDAQQTAWLRGDDLSGVVTGYAAGTVLLVRDSSGRLLGRGRAQAQRLKNLLPRRLV